MKTLQQIKDEYAIEQGYKDWAHLMIDCCINAFRVERHTDAVNILSQQQALKNASENVDPEDCYRYSSEEHTVERIEQSILSENNLVK